MRIVILDSLMKQLDSNSVPTIVIPKVLREFQRLSEMERDGLNSVEEYLKNHHGIKMKGVEKIFKYELTDGDRMLYAYSADIPWLASRVGNSIVLLRFSKHDDQGDVAKKYDLRKERGYKYLEDIIEEMSDLDIDAVNNSDISLEDYVALAEILNSDDYTSWHKAYVIEDAREYSALSLDDMDIYLSDEQDKCITEYFAKPTPTLIIGGAGTGKTLIAVHLLIDYSKNNTKNIAAYFTQSPELRKKVMALFKQYGGDVDTQAVEFNDINEYCIRELGLRHSSIVYTREFLMFVDNTPEIFDLCRSNGISPIVVWTEIRGIIKGGMSPEWSKSGTMPQEQFTGNIKSLEKRGYLERLENNKKRVKLANNSPSETKKRMDCDGDLNDSERENLNRAIEYFSGFDPSIRCLSENEYMNVPEEVSSVEKEKRPFIYDICKRYDDYLVRNSLYDENDLVRMMFEHGVCSTPRLNFSVIDEVQDYTELQIFLIKTLTKGDQIVFAGDEHQNINPAAFSESRIRSLFFKNKTAKLNTKRLKKNYRCQQEIIDITNALAGIRRAAIGSGSAENEAPEEAIRESDAIPNRLEFNDSNLTSCICELVPYPKAVFLVPDQTTKKCLLERINQQKDVLINRIGEEKFQARLSSAVFTVAEIKGVEYEYVVCYDLIGSNIDNWQRILSGVHHQTQYRYYFNLLYVAMTRAQEYLCLIDTHISKKLDKQIGISTIQEFDAEQLYFNRLSSSETDWYDQALELEKNGQYRQAKEYYLIANAEPSCIFRCDYYISLEERDYDTAVANAIALNSPELIEGYLDDIQAAGIKQLAEAFICLETDPMHYVFRQINISMLIQSAIPEEIQSTVQDVFLRALSNAINIHVNETLGI